MYKPRIEGQIIRIEKRTSDFMDEKTGKSRTNHRADVSLIVIESSGKKDIAAVTCWLENDGIVPFKEGDTAIFPISSMDAKRTTCYSRDVVKVKA